MSNHIQVIMTVCVRSEEHLETGLLTFKTLRTGFPNAVVLAINNASIPAAEFYIDEWCKKTESIRIDMPERQPHHTVFDRVLGRRFNFPRPDMDLFEHPNAQIVFLDSDLIFYKSCEDFQFYTGLAGMLIPWHSSRYTGTPTAERLHTSFLWTRPAQLLAEAKQAKIVAREFADNELFKPQMIYRDRKPLFYDTAANLYHAVGGTAFKPVHHDRYEHIFCGSARDYLRQCLPQIQLAKLLGIHQLALTDPAKVKGFNASMEWLS